MWSAGPCSSRVSSAMPPPVPTEPVLTRADVRDSQGCAGRVSQRASHSVAEPLDLPIDEATVGDGHHVGSRRQSQRRAERSAPVLQGDAVARATQDPHRAANVPRPTQGTCTSSSYAMPRLRYRDATLRQDPCSPRRPRGEVAPVQARPCFVPARARRCGGGRIPSAAAPHAHCRAVRFSTVVDVRMTKRFGGILSNGDLSGHTLSRRTIEELLDAPHCVDLASVGANGRPPG